MRIAMIHGLLALTIAGIVSVSAAEREMPSPQGADLSAYFDFYGGHGHAMRPESWQSAWSAFGGEVNCRNTGAAGPRRLFYPVHVPNGHQLSWIDIWGWDNTSRDLSVRVLKVCQPYLSGGLPSVTELATGGSTGTPLRFFSPIDVAPDDTGTPSTCSYVVEARFAADGIACAGSDLGVLRVRAQVRNPDLIYRDGFFQQRTLTLMAGGQDSGDQ